MDNIVTTVSVVFFATTALAAAALGAYALREKRRAAAKDRALAAKDRELAAALAARTAALARASEAEVAAEAAQARANEREPLAEVGELSAMVAHEIRNPLTIIGNCVTTLRRPDVPANDREALLTILEEESHRLNAIVTDLLQYARPVSLQMSAFGLRAVVERALSVLPPRADLDVELFEEGPVGDVIADPNVVRQIVENLATNAAQAMTAEGGILTVSLHRTPQRSVRITVEDTGEGMDTSVRDRALKPFFTTRPTGTGLGLAIVARFVHAHGGKLEIQSAAGKGTRVMVTLPQPSPRGDSPDPGKSHTRLQSHAARVSDPGTGPGSKRGALRASG